VRLGAWLMGTEGELALSGRRGVPSRLLAEGFTFHYPQLEAALSSVVQEGWSPTPARGAAAAHGEAD
jgi:NAD dependent epimerase/dehydratase family enzyme